MGTPKRRFAGGPMGARLSCLLGQLLRIDSGANGTKLSLT